MPVCPNCRGSQIVKNGFVYYEKQNFKCKECGRQFVENGQQNQINDETKELIGKLLLEKLSLAGIARVLGISETWLQKYVNKVYESQRLEPPRAKKKGRLTIECDEMWSFVGRKNNKQWIWLAIDHDSREIVGFPSGTTRQEWGDGFMAVVTARLSMISTVPSAIPISGVLTPKCCLKNVIGQLVKRQARPIILNDSITLYVSVSVA